MTPFLIFRYVEVLLVPFAVAFVVCIWATLLAGYLARRVDAVARPSERSLHQGEIPRLGGLALGVTVVIGAALLAYWPAIERGLWLLLPDLRLIELTVLGGGLALIMGVADDLWDLPPLAKLLGQIVIAAVTVLLLGLTMRFPWSNASLQLPIGPMWAQLAAALWIVIMINAANFMDGTDGHLLLMALVQALVYLALLVSMSPAEAGLYLQMIGPFYWSFMMLLLGALCGALASNWPRASTFLGDGGSWFIGYLMAVLPLYLVEQALVARPRGIYHVPLSMVGAFIIAAPLLYDTGLTLLRRLWARQNILRPHRQHLYQRLVLSGMSHRGVLAVGLPLYLWCGLLGFMAMRLPLPTVQIISAGLALIGLFYYTLLVWSVEHAARQMAAETTAQAAAESATGNKSLQTT